MNGAVYRVGGREVAITNPDKVLFPSAGITKRELVEHYLGCAEVMLPWIAGRPLTLRRYPEGIGQEGWFQKHAPAGTPAWVARADVSRGNDGRTVQHLVADGPATLAYLANLAAVELHVAPSPAAAVDRPAELILDLDPPPGAPAAVSRRATRRCRDLLSELGMQGRLKTSGSAGFHIHVSSDGTANQALVREVARGIAAVLARRHPDELTTEYRQADRGQRVLVDWMRNSPQQTAVAPYSVRALEGAPVATPMDWDELAGTDPQRWTIRAVARRLRQRQDAWQEQVPAADLHQVGRQVAQMLSHGVDVERERTQGLGRRSAR